MAAKLRLALPQNSSPTPLANRRRVAQIAVSKGSAFGRPPQRAKYPRRARREAPARRSGRNPPASQSAIRRWRNPRPRAMVRAAAPTGWTAWTINQQRAGYPPPAAGASPRPTGWNPSARGKWNVPASGGTHRSRPTVHVGSPSMFVGRGIPDAPTPHPIRGRQGCRPLRFADKSGVLPAAARPVPYRLLYASMPKASKSMARSKSSCLRM